MGHPAGFTTLSPLPLLCPWYLWRLVGGGCRKGVPTAGLLGAAHLTAGSAGGIDERAGRAGPARLGRWGDRGCFSILRVPSESQAHPTQSITHLKGAGEAGVGRLRRSGQPQ